MSEYDWSICICIEASPATAGETTISEDEPISCVFNIDGGKPVTVVTFKHNLSLKITTGRVRDIPEGDTRGVIDGLITTSERC